VRPWVGGIEWKSRRCDGQHLPHRPEKGVGVFSEEAPRRRDEPALGQLDVLDQRHVGRGSGSRHGQRLGQYGERREIGVVRMLLTETMQVCLGALDITTDEAGYDLVDQQGIASIEKEVELSPFRGLVPGRWRRGQSLLAQESDSSQGLPSRTAARRNLMPWLSPGFIQSMRSKTRAASSRRPSLQRQRP